MYLTNFRNTNMCKVIGCRTCPDNARHYCKTCGDKDSKHFRKHCGIHKICDKRECLPCPFNCDMCDGNESHICGKCGAVNQHRAMDCSIDEFKLADPLSELKSCEDDKDAKKVIAGFIIVENGRFGKTVLIAKRSGECTKTPTGYFGLLSNMYSAKPALSNLIDEWFPAYSNRKSQFTAFVKDVYEHTLPNGTDLVYHIVEFERRITIFDDISLHASEIKGCFNGPCGVDNLPVDYVWISEADNDWFSGYMEPCFIRAVNYALLNKF